MCAQVGRYADRRGRIYQKYQYPNCKWNSRVYISHMAVPRKSTQVVNICKPNLLPVTFSFTVLLCSVTGMHKDPLRTMKYKQHTSEKTPEIHSSMKQHHHLRTPTPFCTSVSSKQRYESLHQPPMLGARERIQASRCSVQTTNVPVSLTPVLGWIASNVSKLEHPKTLLSPLRVWQRSPSCLSPGMWTMHTTGKMIAV